MGKRTLLALAVLIGGLSLWSNVQSMLSAQASVVRHQPLQIRTLLQIAGEHCSDLPPDRVPISNRSVSLPQPPASHGSCWRLGPSLLNVNQVAHVRVNWSPSGSVLVSITLEKADVRRFDTLVSHMGRKPVVFVILGQILEQATRNELAQPSAVAGTIQVLGGLFPTDTRPVEIAAALRAPLIPPPAINTVLPGVRPCGVASLTVRGGRQGEAFQTDEATIVLTNSGSKACALSGDPTMSIAQSDGSALPVKSHVTPHTVTPVTLQPGGSAALITNWANWCGGALGPLTIEILVSGTSRDVVGSFDGPPNYNAVPGCTNLGHPSILSLVDGYIPWIN
jgi:hypothetical protein